jgi:hypothetical protein
MVSPAGPVCGGDSGERIDARRSSKMGPCAGICQYDLGDGTMGSWGLSSKHCRVIEIGEPDRSAHGANGGLSISWHHGTKRPPLPVSSRVCDGHPAHATALHACQATRFGDSISRNRQFGRSDEVGRDEDGRNPVRSPS